MACFSVDHGDRTVVVSNCDLLAVWTVADTHSAVAVKCEDIVTGTRVMNLDRTFPYHDDSTIIWAECKRRYRRFGCVGDSTEASPSCGIDDCQYVFFAEARNLSASMTETQIIDLRKGKLSRQVPRRRVPKPHRSGKVTCGNPPSARAIGNASDKPLVTVEDEKFEVTKSLEVMPFPVTKPVRASVKARLGACNVICKPLLVSQCDAIEI
jgi:hypothetical protein